MTDNNVYGMQYPMPSNADFTPLYEGVMPGYNNPEVDLVMMSSYYPYSYGGMYDPYSAYYTQYLQQYYAAKTNEIKETYDKHLQIEQQKELD
jgi:hypothetical protein